MKIDADLEQIAEQQIINAEYSLAAGILIEFSA